MKNALVKIFYYLLFISVLSSLYIFWFIALPSIANEFWRGFVTLLVALATPIYLLFAGCVCYFGILGKLVSTPTGGIGKGDE